MGMQAQQISRNPTQRSCRMSGTDFVGTVTINAGGGEQYSLLANYPVSVSAFPGTWLATQSKLWERYRFNRLSFRFVPATATSVACQLVGWIDTDPYDDPLDFGNNESVIRQALSQYGSSAFNIITPARFDLAQRKDREEYYTGPDRNNLRFTRAGNFFLAQVTRATGFDGKLLTDAFECGSLYVDWDVSFETPQIDPPTTADEGFELVSAVTGIIGLPVDTKGQTVSLDLGSLPWKNLLTGAAAGLVAGTKYRARVKVNSSEFGQTLQSHYDYITDIRTSSAPGYQSPVLYSDGAEAPLGTSLYPTANDSSGFDALWNVQVQGPGSSALLPLATLHASELVTTRTDGSVEDPIDNGAIKTGYQFAVHSPDAFGNPSATPGPGPPLSDRPVVDGFFTDFVYAIGTDFLIEFLPSRWQKAATLGVDLAIELLALL
jgi:hypothetical protein